MASLKWESTAYSLIIIIVLHCLLPIQVLSAATSGIHSCALASAGVKSDHVNGVVYGAIREAHKGIVVASGV